MIKKTFLQIHNLRLLRTLSVFIILVIVIVLSSVIFIGFPKISTFMPVTVVRGNIDMSDAVSADFLTKLNGEWEFYENLTESGDSYDSVSLVNPEYVEMPIRSFSQAEKKGTYRLLARISPELSPFALYLPVNNPQMTIYVNGMNPRLLPGITGYEPAKSIIHIKEPASDTIEIIISTDGNTHYSSLYKEPVIFGSLEKVVNYTFWTVTNSFLIVGMLIIILVNGYVFMLIMPGHKMITLITLFDSALMFRLLSGMNIFLYFLNFLFPSFLFSDEFFLSMQILFLMIAGFVGCLLSQYLFDPENIIPRKISYFSAVLYLVAGVVFSINVSLFREIGSTVILGIYIFSFILVFCQFWITLKKRRSGYYYFQIGKTIYIGIIVLFDILSLNVETDILLLSYLYTVFFMAHLFVRLYDNNISYKDAAKLNANLEQIVEKRTEELVAANKRLAEISIRDPLTGAFNRLYFEQRLEQLLMAEKREDNIHVCMFDLDYFKKINDTYGHDVGDEQLQEAVSTVTGALGANSFLARIGGEEFAILNTKDSSEQFLAEIESIRCAVEKLAEENPRRTTASFGIARYLGGMTQKELLKLADNCLYKAKKTGRNTTVTDFRGFNTQENA